METIGVWCRKFAGKYAKWLRKCCGPVGDSRRTSIWRGDVIDSDRQAHLKDFWPLREVKGSFQGAFVFRLLCLSLALTFLALVIGFDGPRAIENESGIIECSYIQ
jgi:hypothetical protein